MTYNNYEFTAFKGSDLFSNGPQWGCSFTMADRATTEICVSDDDSMLSGKSFWGNWGTDWIGQCATVDGVTKGKTYVKSYWTVTGSDGKTYKLAQVDVPSSGWGGHTESYYTFVNNVPPAGVTLTVTGCSTAGHSGISYSCLGAGSTKPPADMGQVSGRLTIDADQNNSEWNDQTGTWDEGVCGRTVQLLDQNNNVVATTTTDANGNYCFNVEVGTYQVRFTKPDGYVYSEQRAAGVANDRNSDADANGLTGFFNLTKGAHIQDIDAGIYCPPSPGWISGRLTYDADGNNSEWNDQTNSWDQGVAGRTVNLLDINGNVVATTTTSSNGSYTFDVAPGDYRVQFTKPDGYTYSEKHAAGVVWHANSDADQNGLTDVIKVVSGSTVSNIDAGLIETPEPAKGCIFGRLSFDADKNNSEWNATTGAFDAGIAGQTVQLLDANGNVVATTTTDADGKYSFEAPAGTYKVRFTKPDGTVYAQKDAPGVPEDRDSDANSNGVTDAFTLAGGQNVCDIDASVQQANRAPVAQDDAAKVCYDKAGNLVLNVLANDTDADGDNLTVTQIKDADETVGVGGTITLASGATATLNANGTVTFASNGVGNNLISGETLKSSFSYTISDGNGGSDMANVDVTLVGATDTLSKIDRSLPDGTIKFQITDTYDSQNPAAGEAFTVKLSQTGDSRLEGLTVTEAYCLGYFETLKAGDENTPIDNAPMLFGNIAIATKEAVQAAGLTDNFNNTGGNGQKAIDNLDLINWIINQDFNSSAYAGAGFSNGVTDAEIQGAIWQLTDGKPFVANGAGTQADALKIAQLAMANGEGFTPGAGQKIGLFIDANDATEAAGHSQPFLVAVNYDSLTQDCIA